MRARTGLRRGFLLAPLLTVTLATAASTAASAQSSADGACPEGDGVTVVVDFGPENRDPFVRCGRGIIENGLDVLAEARIAYDPYPQEPGRICRIDAAPVEGECGPEVSPDATWSYWTAEPGGSWELLDVGPLGRTPPDGSVDGWSLSDGEPREPDVAPPTPGEDRPDPDPVITDTPTPADGSPGQDTSPTDGSTATAGGDGGEGDDDEAAPSSGTSNPSSEGAGGAVTREPVDTDGDGEVDATADVTRDADGLITSILVDTDGDDVPDTPAEVRDGAPTDGATSDGTTSDGATSDGATSGDGSAPLAVDLLPPDDGGATGSPVLPIVAAVLVLAVGGALHWRRRGDA